MLGEGADFFGVWDRAANSPAPLEQFPRTDEGWRAANNSFENRERAVASTVGMSVGAGVPAQPTGAATTGGVLGIVGFILGWIPILGIFLGLLLGVLAVIFSGIGLARTKSGEQGHSMAVTGLVLGIIIIVFKLIPGFNLL